MKSQMEGQRSSTGLYGTVAMVHKVPQFLKQMGSKGGHIIWNG